LEPKKLFILTIRNFKQLLPEEDLEWIYKGGITSRSSRMPFLFGGKL
jgi:hypothetical protein